MPSKRIDGSSVNVIPASSGVSSSSERNGSSCTSSADPVAHTVPEVVTETGLLDRGAAGGVDLRASAPGTRGGAARLLRGEHDREAPSYLRGGSPQTTVRPKSEQ